MVRCPVHVREHEADALFLQLGLPALVWADNDIRAFPIGLVVFDLTDKFPKRRDSALDLEKKRPIVLVIQLKLRAAFQVF